MNKSTKMQMSKEDSRCSVFIAHLHHRLFLAFFTNRDAHDLVAYRNAVDHIQPLHDLPK